MILGPVALSRRMADIAPFYVMALLARARELEAAGRSIVHLEIGESDFPTAASIIPKVCAKTFRAIRLVKCQTSRARIFSK